MKYFHTLKANIFQALCSVDFAISIIGISFLCIISVWNYLPQNSFKDFNIINIFDLLIGLSAFKKILVILAAIPVVTSFCSDWNCEYIRPIIIRSGIKNYIWSKVVSCVCLSFFSVFIGVSLFVGVLSIWIPLIPNDLSSVVFPPFDSVAINISPILYLTINIFVFSLGSAFWVMTGLTISAFIPNRFVAIMTPLICSYILEDLTINIFPSYINLYQLTRVYDVIHQGALISFLYFILIFGILIFLAGLIFSRQIKRRIHNEIV